jgi:hypothetical protein
LQRVSQRRLVDLLHAVEFEAADPDVTLFTAAGGGEGSQHDQKG